MFAKKDDKDTQMQNVTERKVPAPMTLNQLKAKIEEEKRLKE